LRVDQETLTAEYAEETAAEFAEKFKLRHYPNYAKHGRWPERPRLESWGNRADGGQLRAEASEAWSLWKEV